MTVPAYTPATVSLDLPRTEAKLILRGLNLDDVSTLMQRSFPEVVRAFEEFRDGLQANFSTTRMDQFAITVFKFCPRLCAEVIALAAGDPDGTEQVLQYPLGVQARALLAVAELSLEEMGDLSDPSPALVALVRSVLRASESLRRTSSLTGTGTSAAPPPR